MRIISEPALDFSDVLIQPQRSSLVSRSEVNVCREIHFKGGHSCYDVPIIAANMDQVATFEMADALARLGVSTALHKHYTLEEYAKFFTSMSLRSDTRTPIFFTIGSSDKEFSRLANLYERVPLLRFICVDNANGYTENFNRTIEKIRNAYPEMVIMAGNVVSPGMTEQLILSGADIVKVGIGSGSVCTTRKITGVGLPQLTATIECADAAHGLGGYICSDGGMTVPGDIVKAFAAGADFVMLGGMFSGHRETGLPILNTDEGEFMEFYGMSSKAAMDRHANGVATYRASEGKRVLIPVKGSISETVGTILGGIRSACTYVGARELKHLSKRTTFRVVNRQLNTVYGND